MSRGNFNSHATNPGPGGLAYVGLQKKTHRFTDQFFPITQRMEEREYSQVVPIYVYRHGSIFWAGERGVNILMKTLSLFDLKRYVSWSTEPFEFQ